MIPWWPMLVGYAVGSLPVGYAVVRLARGIDLRRVGSGNVGATNVYRTAGIALALVVMTVDVAKGAVSVWLMPGGGAAAAAGVAVIVGHIYPVWLGFRGGKGVATGLGVFAVLAPGATLVAAAVFVMVVAGTRLVSLGSMAAAAVLPLAEWWRPGSDAIAIAATVAAALILFRHKGNAQRLWRGSERALGA